MLVRIDVDPVPPIGWIGQVHQAVSAAFPSWGELSLVPALGCCQNGVPADLEVPLDPAGRWLLVAGRNRWQVALADRCAGTMPVPSPVQALSVALEALSIG